MGKLFGTDGIRGVAGSQITAELAMNVGRAAAMVLREHGDHSPLILIGKDTRRSGDMLEAALTAGILSVGANVRILGVVPTPAVAFLVREYGADAGVMISASHNPNKYNGIKLFNAEGYKLSDELEDEIERVLERGGWVESLREGDDVGTCSDISQTAANDYIRHLISGVEQNFAGLRVALDCANGSASVTAKRLFSAMGASLVMIGDEPNGLNINENCGSTHIELLAETVKKHRCHVGLAFDGDADRCLAVDEEGSLIDGDKLIAIFAKDMRRMGTLKGDTAVVTVMSNLGFFHFAEREGIHAATTKVGDRYVLEEMQKHGYSLGGEQSGHIIFGAHSTTGDGQLTGLRFLEILARTGQKASALACLMERYPQVMLGIRAEGTGKERCMEDALVQEEIRRVGDELGKEGRVLVRASGTEPLIRVMVEGRDFDRVNQVAVDVTEFIKARLKELP